jgi:hypothetical protein
LALSVGSDLAEAGTFHAVSDQPLAFDLSLIHPLVPRHFLVNIFTVFAVTTKILANNYEKFF